MGKAQRIAARLLWRVQEGDKGEKKKDTSSVTMECLKASSHASEEIFVAVKYGGHSLAM